MATIYDKASLVMIPSGVKDGKAYSIKPTDGSGDFTFSRGTDTATRVNASGLIEKERGNQFLQSNTFSNASWDKNNTSVTGGQSGYDGSSDAFLLTEDSATAEHRLRQNPSFGGVCTISVYAKANTRDWLWLRGVLSGVNVRAWFDLANGVVGSTDGAVIDHNIESVGGGWYRCSMTLNHTAAFENYIGIADADLSTSYAGNGTGSIYIQDAMLNEGLVAQPYIETTTAAVYEGITDNLPRLDYSGGASCPSLLLEPSRTNGLPQSEYFNAWTALNDLAITANSITSPEGLLNGSLMAASGVGATARSVRQGSQSTSTDIKTMSVYAKANASNYIQLYHSGEVQAYANFDLSSGAVGTSGTNATADIEPMGNDWYRCIVTFDSGANFGSSVYIGFATSASASYGGGSVADTSSVYIFGAQYEIGSYPTSYIPTYGTSASRAGDSCVKTGISSLIGQTEGTLFVEYNSNITEDDSFFLVADDGTGNNRIVLYSNIPNNLALVISNGGSLQTIIPNIPLASGTNKFAVGYANNDVVLYLNGTQVGSDNTSTIPATSALRMGTDHNNASIASGKGTKQALVFKTRLTNAELAALTTL